MRVSISEAVLAAGFLQRVGNDVAAAHRVHGDVARYRGIDEHADVSAELAGQIERGVDAGIVARFAVGIDENRAHDVFLPLRHRKY